MKTIKWDIGDSVNVERRISSQDWKGLDINDQNQVVWNEKNGFTAEVSDSAAEHLLKNEKFFSEVSASAPEPGVVETQVVVPEPASERLRK